MRLWHYAVGLLLVMRSDVEPWTALQPGFVARSVVVDGSSHRYQVYVPSGWTAASRWPVVLSLHGGGGYGRDGAGQVAEGLAPAIVRHPERFPVIAVFPQSPDDGTPGWQRIGGRIAMAALDATLEEFSGDRTRVALTGLSVGGNGVWSLAYRYPERFSRLLVLCGFVSERMGVMQPILYPALAPGVPDGFAAVAERVAHLPTWILHGDRDQTVSVDESRRMAAALQRLGAPVRYTELAGFDHDIWSVTYERQDVASWLVGQP